MIDTERRERVAELSRHGYGVRDIARLLDVTQRTVYRDRRALGIGRRVVRMTAEQMERAQQLLDEGCSRREVARTVGVSDHTINRHFPGRCWTNQEVGRFAMTNRYRNWSIR